MPAIFFEHLELEEEKQGSLPEWWTTKYTAPQKSNVLIEIKLAELQKIEEPKQEVRSVNGIDAETELANILSNEIMNEINREIIRMVYELAAIK